MKETKFGMLMKVLKISKIEDIKLVNEKQKYIYVHVYLTSSKILPYDIYIYSSHMLSDELYVETTKKQSGIFLRKMEELCNNCKTFKMLEKYMKDDSKLFIYSTHHAIRDFFINCISFKIPIAIYFSYTDLLGVFSIDSFNVARR